MAISLSRAMSQVSVRRIDHGYRKIQQVAKDIALRKSFVKAGVLGGKREDGKLTNALIAIWNEYGTTNAPARPFIRPAFENNRSKYIGMLQRLVAKKVYAGDMSYPRALAVIGQVMAADMKAYVTRGPEIPPPNAPATLKRKRALNARRSGVKGEEVPQGDPRTLVDSGRTVGSITYAVVEHGAPAPAVYAKGHAGDRP